MLVTLDESLRTIEIIKSVWPFFVPTMATIRCDTNSSAASKMTGTVPASVKIQMAVFITVREVA